MFQVKQSWGCCSRLGRHLSLLAWCKHGGDNRGQRHGAHRASMRAKLWGSPRLTHSPLGWSPTPSNTHGPSSEARLVQAMGQRPTGATLVPGWWEQRGWAGPRPQGGSTGAPTQVGWLSRAFPSTAGSCFTQKHRVLCGFGKSLFSPRRRAGYRFSKPAPRKSTGLCFLPALPGLPPLPLRAARLLRRPNLQDFQAWLKYFSVIWCRGRSRLKLTQIYSSLPG